MATQAAVMSAKATKVRARLTARLAGNTFRARRVVLSPKRVVKKPCAEALRRTHARCELMCGKEMGIIAFSCI